MKPTLLQRFFPWGCVAALLIVVGLVVLRGAIVLDDPWLETEGSVLLLIAIIYCRWCSSYCI